LHTVPIGVAEWQVIAVFALPILIVPEAVKSLFHWRRGAA
jgi:Ca2+-transporting ATPase